MTVMDKCVHFNDKELVVNFSPRGPKYHDGISHVSKGLFHSSKKICDTFMSKKILTYRILNDMSKQNL